MVTVSTRNLKDRLSSYLRRAEQGERVVVLRSGRPVAALISLADLPQADERDRLDALEARGLLIKPQAESPRFLEPRVPARGRSASEMVIEDRR